MFPSATLLSFLTVALSFSVSAAPLSPAETNLNTLAIAAKFLKDGPINIVAADQARAKALREHGLAITQGKPLSKRESSFPVTNAFVIYTASVGVGSPATQYELIVDTGSSNTWIGANKSYKKTATSNPGRNEMIIAYGSGLMEGHEYKDTITLSPDLVIANQTIGVARIANGFDKFDGILGVGPVDLTKNTLIPDVEDTIPTVTDNLFTSGTISENTLGVFFAPSTESSPEASGELTFGGVDSSKFTGDLAYVPVTETSPASAYWGIDQAISYGETQILDTTAGIVDTGTTLVLLATDAFNAYKSATGAVMDNATGLLKITPSQFENLKTLNFNVGANTYGLIPNAQIWPRALNSQIGGDSSSIYLIVADIGAMSGQGMDFINGYTFLQRFYSVYDTANHRVGFAPTPLTDSTTN